MERKCKNCIYRIDVDEHLACELDGETVNRENSCDFFDEDMEVIFVKNTKKGRFQ